MSPSDPNPTTPPKNAMAHQFIRPDLRRAASAQEAYDQAHEHLRFLLSRLEARHAGCAHRDVRGDWGLAGTLQHQIDLAEQLLDAAVAR